MDAALCVLSDQIDDATQRLLGTARVIAAPDLGEPSRLPGWSRAYVLAHLCRGADTMRGLLAGARDGPARPAGAGPGASPAAIAAETEAAARRPAAELLAELAASAMALRTVARQLPDAAWACPIRVPVPGIVPFPAAQLLPRRLTEVELHHVDLDAGYGPADWPASFTALDLPEPMRSWRAERQARPAR